MTYTVETLKDGKWKADRKYKIFENAERRVTELHHNGINARLIEVKR